MRYWSSDVSRASSFEAHAVRMFDAASAYSGWDVSLRF